MTTPIETAAERLSDSLTQLGVDPDERPEHGGRSIAEVLGAAALASLTQHRDDIALRLAQAFEPDGDACAEDYRDADAVLAYLTGEA